MGDYDYEARFVRIEYRGGRGRPLETIKMRKSSLAKFWRRMILHVDGVGCWEWIGSKHSEGYGRFKTAGHCFLAHRLSYTLACGPVPAGMDLDHTCRNRACVNPAHLEPVTNLENCRRGLQTASIRGERNIHAKLTAASVSEIRALCAAGVSQRQIARRFGVCQATVGHINTGRNWSHSHG